MSYFGEIKIVDKATGRAADVTENGELRVVAGAEDFVDEGNSTETPLGGSGVFVGESVDTLGYAGILVAIQSDKASSILGLAFQFSHNGTDWLWSKAVSFAPGSRYYYLSPIARYFRISFTNGGTAQTTFHIATILKQASPNEAQYYVDESLNAGDLAPVRLAVLKGYRSSTNNFQNLQLTNNNNLKASVEELNTNISVNTGKQLKVSQHTADGVEGALLQGTSIVAGRTGIDPLTGNVAVVEAEHLEIHRGNHRICADYSLAVAALAVVDLLIRPGDSYMHLTFDIFASQGAIVEVYEGTIISALGTMKTTINNSRVGIPSVDQRVYEAPTVDTVGLKLFSLLAGGARQAGIAERNHELILNPNTNYLFRITSRANNNDIDWGFSWYERSSV